MADDDQKSEGQEEVAAAAEKAEEAAEKAEEAAEKAEEAADKAQESSEKVEAAAEEKQEESKKEDPKVSKKLEGLISDIEKLSVLELAELVKALESKFGVTAAAPVAVAAGSAAPAAGEDAGSEQTTFNVVLADGGANKISVIKVVRELVPTLGLKEAKDLVDGAPKNVLEGVNKETSAEAKTKLEAAGAKVELK